MVAILDCPKHDIPNNIIKWNWAIKSKSDIYKDIDKYLFNIWGWVIYEECQIVTNILIAGAICIQCGMHNEYADSSDKYICYNCRN